MAGRQSAFGRRITSNGVVHKHPVLRFCGNGIMRERINFMVKVAQIRDIMTAKVLTVKDTDTLDYVAGLFEKYDYDGLPVVDSGGVLKGIITAYDMVVQSSGMHLPTLFNIMDQISVDKADKAALEGHFNKLKTVKASEIMNSNPLTVKPETLVEEAAKELNMDIFCKIINKEIPSNIILENSDFLAFHDINPKAPVHILAIPKVHVDSFNEVTPEIMKNMTTFIQDVAKEMDIDKSGYRVITNVGEDGAQEVKHLHFHIFGGAKLAWSHLADANPKSMI